MSRTVTIRLNHLVANNDPSDWNSYLRHKKEVIELLSSWNLVILESKLNDNGTYTIKIMDFPMAMKNILDAHFGDLRPHFFIDYIYD